MVLSSLKISNISLYLLNLSEDVANLNSVPLKKPMFSQLQSLGHQVPHIPVNQHPPHHPDQFSKSWVEGPKLLKAEWGSR